MSKRIMTRAAQAVAGLSMSLALGLSLGTGAAGAQTLSGWIGPTAPSNGIIYLHYSTISNTPLYAETRVYTQLGSVTPPHDMGVQSRLFKSGVMCKINDFKYNSVAANSFTDRTSGDCGTGSYNSHGFVSVFDGSNYVTYPTFPTNPLNYTAPPALTARGADSFTGKAESGTNSRGETFGSAADPDNSPDLIASYGTNGELGYVKASDLPAADPNSRAGQGSSIPLYASDGQTVKGEFTIN